MLSKTCGCLEMRRPLICGLAVEFPSKVALLGESRVVRGRFTPPNGFWRGISEHKFNSH
jgi:hypothetical protein